jgi:hypothetical protein
MSRHTAALRREIPVEGALKELADTAAGEKARGTAPGTRIEIWDEEVAVVRVRRGWDGNESLAWIHAPAGGAVRVSRSDRAPGPLPDALTRGLEGIADAVAAALGIR